MSVLQGDARIRREIGPGLADHEAHPSVAAAREAIRAAQRRLLGLQDADGHWSGELEGDSILESEYVLTMHFLGRSGEAKVRKAGSYLLATQMDGGGWSTYPGGPTDVNPTVKAYFALKLLGERPAAPHMTRARDEARRLGGLDACNSFTRIYLAIFGQYPWEDCPAVPPELILFPTWFPFNVYAMSAWSRAIVVPLSMIWALKPSCPVAPWAGIEELRVEGARRARGGRGAWASLFHGVDIALKAAERVRLRPLRRLAMQRAEAWIRRRLEASDGLGAIFPPIINTIIAFRALGVTPDNPTLAGQIQALEKLEIEEGETLRVRPCFSPVWDTALALDALVESGVAADDPRLRRAAGWVMRHEVRRPGDWQVGCQGTEPGGWYFEYANEFYPDCDDTAQVITSLSKVDLAAGDRGRRDRQIARATRWLSAMQCENGGWASFDRDCDRELLTAIPFADHNAMIDPPTVDITARVIEALIRTGASPTSPTVRRGIAFLLAEQEPDGSWFGRWGCNYLYGTWLALSALQCVGEDMRAPWARMAREWLLSCQNADGGWGELPSSYSDPRAKGQGPSTASQTAWALLGLIAAGATDSTAARHGVLYLLDRQQADGGWRDAFWTGTGFPKVFYLKYHLYATYFPLLALARWLGAQRIDGTGEQEQ